MLSETCILFNCMRYIVSLAINRYHHLMDAFSYITTDMQHFLSPNRDFDFIWSAMYGNCFTFNFDQGSARRSHMPGPQYGE